MQPTYFVKHHDGRYSEADPHPSLHEIRSLLAEIDELRNRLSQKMADCVKAEQRQEKDATAYWDARESMAERIETLHSENERLRSALQKIADWGGAWGPYPETNEAWCSMAVVTARHAVPNSEITGRTKA